MTLSQEVVKSISPKNKYNPYTDKAGSDPKTDSNYGVYPVYKSNKPLTKNVTKTKLNQLFVKK